MVKKKKKIKVQPRPEKALYYEKLFGGKK